jgi:uncharacterized membrane protein
VTKAIAALAVLGLAISVYLTWVHYAGIKPVCTGISDCERVQTSDYADLVGIPVAVLGIAGYAAILASLGTRVEVTALLAYLAVAFSAYLTWAEVFKIDAICQWCVGSAIITLVIAVLATVRALGAPLHHRALS